MTVAKRAMKRDKSRKSNLHDMFMDDEKVGKTRALLVARERETRAVLSTVCPRMSTLWPHRDVGQRASIDEFDLEDSESKKKLFKDDHREQPCWKFAEQTGSRERFHLYPPILEGLQR